MRACQHCGKENSDEIAFCEECGLGMGDFRIPDPASQATKGSDDFFRWRAASIILNTIALLYWLVALGYVWIGSVFSERGSQHMAHLMYWGALYNVVIAVLCFAGRQMMRLQTRISLVAGVLAVMAALSFVIWIWVVNLRIKMPYPLRVIEALLVWFPLVYVIIYGFRASNGKRAE